MAEIIVQKETPSYYATRVVWTLLSIIETILALQFLLALIGANRTAGFTDVIYTLASPLLAPFANIIRSTASGTNGGVIAWTTLIAMAVYWLLGWAITRLFFLGTSADRIDYVDRP